MAAAGAASGETNMAAAEAVAAAEPDVPASATKVTTATLRPQRHGQGESERRDGHQATHTATRIISLEGKKGCLAGT